MKWAAAVVLTVALAVFMARRANAAALPAGASDDDVQAYVQDEWDSAEPDQLPDVFEAAAVAVSPSTYRPAGVSMDQAQQNLSAFLTMVGYSEGADYDVLFGGSRFSDFAEHPRVYVPFRNTTSSAAGRYQILWKTWVVLRDRLGLPDFSPASQDAAATELIRERGALNDVYAGRFDAAVKKVAPIWASLPGAGYNQPERQLSALRSAYQGAGGTMEA